jgi:hypothetical protein
MPTYLKIKYEIVNKMKNKPYMVTLRTSDLPNEIQKGYQNLVRLSQYEVMTELIVSSASFLCGSVQKKKTPLRATPLLISVNDVQYSISSQILFRCSQVEEMIFFKLMLFAKS